MYYVTIFGVISDIQFGTTRFQEIDKKFIRKFDTIEEAIESLNSIKNVNIMKNFPFAAIEYILNKGKNNIINEQILFKFDEASVSYEKYENRSGFPLSTLTRINPFGDAEYKIKSTH